ncbi:MAG TPA: FadR/GntR family transcriptional regulator [Acidimicrobiales bacterium]|nr:FadR/GntR family transcriptional regulator [Acidimicrobiales bacterium]
MTVAKKIVEEISRRNYPPGTKLPTEREMLEQYGVGRGTLRESLRFLEMNGVVTMKPGPGGGPIVGEPDSRDLAGTLGLFLQLHDTSFRSIVEVRLLLEPIIAGLAAEKAPQEMLDRIGESVQAMDDGLGDEERFLEANEEFHELVAWASGNAVFALLICSLHWITDGSPLGVDYPEARRKAVLRAHREVYEALAARDSAKASVTMARHLDEFRRYVEQYYPAVYSSPLRWGDISP